MSLNIQQLLQHLPGISQARAQREQAAARQLPIARKALERCAQETNASINQRIQEGQDHPSIALLTEENPFTPIEPESPKSPYSVLAADGSQVYPDRHQAALYYLINIGSILLSVGSGQTPITRTTTKLFYRHEDLFPGGEYLIDAELIHAMRDVAELHELVRLASESNHPRPLALLDNGLGLWYALQDRDQAKPRAEEYLHAFLSGLDHLRDRNIPLAGYIDRSQSREVIHMLQACSRGDRSQEFEVPMVASEINDALLFQTHLPPGTRSARFERTGRLPERYRLSGHGIHFFYFNTGHQNQIARIEIPQWVGEDGEAMKALHAILLEQCSGLGYPYVLIRAHECAVVSQGDRASLEAMIQGSFLAQGMQPHPSRKAQAKRWVRKKW